MKNVTRTILTLALAASAAWAGDPPTKEATPLPAPVVKAEETLSAAVSKAYAAYLKTVEAEVKKAQAALEKEKQAATKAGKLEVALAIKGKQDALTVEAVVAEAGKKLSADELLGGVAKVDVAKAIVGKWATDGNKVFNARSITFTNDGKFTDSIGNSGTWWINEPSGFSFRIDGHVRVFSTTIINGNTVIMSNTHGDPLSITKK